MVLLNLINQDYCPVKFTEGGVDDFDKPESFAELICGLTELFSTGDINIDLVTAFLASYDVRTEDWNDFVTFNKNGFVFLSIFCIQTKIFTDIFYAKQKMSLDCNFNLIQDFFSKPFCLTKQTFILTNGV